MMRNDYRRALILLRGNAPGCSGHVRLERRTLMGSMYFLLQVPPECTKLQAALVGRDKNGCYACSVGETQRDARGQAVLSYSFDPRNICGRELEQYRMIAVSCLTEGHCRILLSGNLSGHAELDWNQVQDALCSLYMEESAPGDGEEVAGELPAPQEIPETVPDTAEPEYTEQESTTDDALQSADADSPDDAPVQTAGQLLNLDPDLPWPESIEPLRSLFQLSVPMENPPDGEYNYIAAAMPAESGYSHCAVGVRIQDGMPVSVRYGMPARWSAEPPAGLEDYSWVGDGNRGWWMIQVDILPCGSCISSINGITAADTAFFK